MWCARVVVGTDAILLRDAGPFAQQFGIVLCISTWPVKSDEFKPLHTHTRQVYIYIRGGVIDYYNMNMCMGICELTSL